MNPGLRLSIHTFTQIPTWVNKKLVSEKMNQGICPLRLFGAKIV
jgi:hypothetical protein